MSCDNSRTGRDLERVQQVLDGIPATSSRLTPDVQARILVAVSRGASYKQCAACGPVTRKTLYNWLQRGRAESEEKEDSIEETPLSEYARFYRAFQFFEAQMGLEMLDTIRDAARAGPQYWAAAMTLLERRFPEDFGRRAADIVGGPPASVQIQVVFRNDWRTLSQNPSDDLDAHFLPDDEPIRHPQPALPSPGPGEGDRGGGPP